MRRLVVGSQLLAAAGNKVALDARPLCPPVVGVLVVIQPARGVSHKVAQVAGIEYVLVPCPGVGVEGGHRLEHLAAQAARVLGDLVLEGNV